MYRYYLKRWFDVVVGLILLLLLSPVLLTITVLLFWANWGTPFFFQDRPGYCEKKIQIIKFKSMNDKCDDSGELLPDNLRLTSIGRFIRKTSLDEIPQLFNVIKGDMSLVGPRPLLYKYLPLYSIEQRRRHEVRPGITGWAQVNGRNSISWSEKFRHDLYYVDHLSFVLDLKILWLTVIKVLKREGVNQNNDRPMEPFNGHN